MADFDWLYIYSGITVIVLLALIAQHIIYRRFGMPVGPHELTVLTRGSNVKAISGGFAVALPGRFTVRRFVRTPFQVDCEVSLETNGIALTVRFTGVFQLGDAPDCETLARLVSDPAAFSESTLKKAGAERLQQAAQKITSTRFANIGEATESLRDHLAGDGRSNGLELLLIAPVLVTS